MNQRELFPAFITCLILLVYVWNFFQAGSARGKHKILAPAVAGHPEFERKLRIQQNMVEFLVLFIPSLWIFSLTIDVLAGAVLGLISVIGRILYSVSYAKDPAKRGPGFGLAVLPALIMLIGGLIGVLRLHFMGL